MKCYRFKHIPTGMYYRPSRGDVQIKINNPDGTIKVRTRVKTNLSKKGKIYPKPPSWSWLGGSYYNHIYKKELILLQNLDRSSTWRIKNQTFPVVPGEWII